jgi:hypothetical protein
MSTLEADARPMALKIAVDDDFVTVDLSDGRQVRTPVMFYPRLANATTAERDRYELIGDGEGVSWPLLDEDLSTESIVSGRKSAESQASFARWLEQRKA